MEADLQKKIDGIHHQIDLLSDKRNTIIQVNRVAKTAIDVFRDILEKDKLERNDLELLIDKILVYEDHLEIKLKADIDTLLRCGTLSAETEEAANFSEGTENIELQSVGADAHIRPRVDEGIDPYETELVQSAKNREDKVFRVHVISNGDPLEIYTTRDGEVIFKKYSLISGLEDFAAQFCDTLSRSTDFTVAVTDRDAVVAVAGSGKRELMGKPLSAETSELMEGRSIYQYAGGAQQVMLSDANGKFAVSVAAPILSGGDVLGLVVFLSAQRQVPGETEYKLAQTVAAFLGKHMEG